MLGREWTLNRSQLVVVEAIDKDGKIGGDGEDVEAVETHTVASLRVRHGLRPDRDAGSCSGIGTHFLVTCSSVLTENFLYAVNWCKLRQCCLGVSTSTRAEVGNQYTTFESEKGTGAKSISEFSAFRPTSCKESAIPA